MKKYTFIILAFLPFSICAQVITTFAGGGTSGIGDGGLATAAEIPDPIGGVFDKFGNYYCAEAVGYDAIRMISNTGIITTIAGNGMSGFSGDNGPATNAMLANPTSVKLDNFGNFYIADVDNMRIRKVDAATGIITTIAGSSLSPGFGGDNGPATAALLFAPSDLCFDKSGNLYIADEQNYRIRRIDTFGIITTFAGTGAAGYTGDGGPATAARIGILSGIIIDDTGNVYIAAGVVVRKIDTAGIISTFAGVNGEYLYTGDGVPATDAPISPIKLAIDDSGQLVIADDNNYRIFRIDHSGIIHSIAGNGIAGFSGDGGPATVAEFNYATGVCFDTCGNLYVPETNNNDIRKIAFNPYCWPEKVNEIPLKQLHIYPNPAQNELYIDNVKPETSYTIINITGIIEQSGTLQEGSNHIAIKALPEGLYIVEIVDNVGAKIIKKFVKEQ